MYHYTIQPTYHHNLYQQHQSSVNPINNEIKCRGDTLAAVNQFIPNSQNVTIVASDTVDKAPAIEQTRKNIKSVKKASVDTSNFSIEERLVAAVWVHERNRTDVGISQIKRDFRQRFGREPPSKNTLLAWERKLFSTGSVCDAPRPGRPINRLSRMEEVASSVSAHPALSVRARARQLRLPRSTLRTILSRDLATHPPRLRLPRSTLRTILSRDLATHTTKGKQPVNNDATNPRRKPKVPPAAASDNSRRAPDTARAP